MTEAQLMKATLELAKRLGYRIARLPMSNMRGDTHVPLLADTRGFPDALLVRERLVAVEFKAAGGAQTSAQSDWHCWLGNANVEMHVFRPAQWLDGTIEGCLRGTPSDGAQAVATEPKKPPGKVAS